MARERAVRTAGVIHIISQNLVNDQSSLLNLSDYTKSNNDDIFICNYFDALQKELEEFNL